MADENVIIEGTVKFRDGKKWKSRWCVMRRLSPVADCVQLQLYRGGGGEGRGGGGGGGGRGACCAALSLARLVAAESGFTLDKHSNTLALVCLDLVAVLAFETRERLIQWQVKVSGALGEGRSHVVVVCGGGGGGGGGGGALAAGPARLHVRGGGAALVGGLPPRLLRHWQLHHLRRYGVVEGRFCLEGGARCGAGEGLAVLLADRPADIQRDFEREARAAPPAPPAAPARPLTLRRHTGASEAGDACSVRAEGGWGAARAERGDDAASLHEGGAGGAGGVALERCVSCMAKLGAMSRSSTAALTPGARHFSPAWTMEAASPPSPPPPPSPPAERPPRPARLPRACSCGVLADSAAAAGPYENYDVPRVPSTEVEGEYYDTPKRLRECLDEDLFRLTRSSTANTLVLKKPCGCLLRLGRRGAARVVAAREEEPPPCACRRVTQWAHAWWRPPAACRRSATAGDLAAADKENATPAADALYATVDLSRKARRRAARGEAPAGPLAHYENLAFALSLEHYENARDMLRRAGVTRAELDAIGANLRGPCGRCARPRPRPAPRDDYLVMEPGAAAAAPPAGYAPMSPVGGCAPGSLRLGARSPAARMLDEKSASNPALGGAAAAPGAAPRRATRPRSSSADSSRFLDDVKEFDGSGGGSASSLETLRGAARGAGRAGDKLSDSSEASKRGGAASPGAAAGGARDSSSSADSGVSLCAPERELPRCSAAARRHWRAARRPPALRAPRPHSTDGPRTAPPPDAAKSSSAEAEVPLLTLRPLRGAAATGADSRSTSSGASDMSDYVETLSLCSSHSSSDAPVTMRAGVSGTLRPRSGKEYARLAAPRRPDAAPCRPDAAPCRPDAAPCRTDTAQCRIDAGQLPGA